MTYFIYRDHTIVSSAVYDVVSGKWKLAASVSSQESGSSPHQLHIVKNRSCFLGSKTPKEPEWKPQKTGRFIQAGWPFSPRDCSCETCPLVSSLKKPHVAFLVALA